MFQFLVKIGHTHLGSWSACVVPIKSQVHGFVSLANHGTSRQSCDRAGEAQVDAHSILLTFCVFIYMSFPFGVSTAATIRVGNLVGANRPSEAKLAGKQ